MNLQSFGLFTTMLVACANGAQLATDPLDNQPPSNEHQSNDSGGRGGNAGGDTGYHDGGGGVGGVGGTATFVCTPDAQQSCYTGPSDTLHVGACHPGLETCNAEGTGFGPCEAEITPSPEDCTTDADDNCNGESNENCLCIPGTSQPCYSGPQGTEGVGICQAGSQSCAADGLSWLPCQGEVLPEPVENINTPDDDDCSGTIHDSLCELHGILTCPSNVCSPQFICGSSGGPLVCVAVWKCMAV